MTKKMLVFLVLVLGSFSLFAQTKTVSGSVTDATDGSPLPGVNVLVQGTTNGTQTDFDGNYTIEVAEGGVLVFSYIGTASQSVTVGSTNTINVAMTEDASQLDEVVVTALGLTKSKKSLTYSTQNVTPEKLTQARSTNVLDGLSGKIAGISVTTGGQGVGSPSKVVLRGNRSIAGSSQPLYVIDGILVNGDIANISPDDIQEISILKGANAAALYGSRANNGAIIVTTKSGKGAKEGVSTNLGFSTILYSAIHLLNLQNEYGQGATGVYSENAVDSWGPRFDGSQVAHWSNDPSNPNFGGTYAYVAQPNNVKDYYQTGHDVSVNASVNINREKSNTFLGYTHTDAEGIVAGNKLKRDNMTLRVTADLTDRLKVDSKINYIRGDFENVLSSGENYDNPYRYLYILPRNIRTQDLEQYDFTNSSGQIRQHFFSPNFNGAGNPYWTRNNVTRPRLDERVLGLLSLKYSLTDDLSIMGRSTIDRTSRTEEVKSHNDTYTRAPNGQFSKNASNSYDWNTDVLLNYKKDISENFAIDVSLGANQRIFKANTLSANGANFTAENFFALSNTTNPTVTESFSEFEVQSAYAFAEFSYKNALFLNVSGRNDWSSTLPSDNRSYFYPSVGLTAVLSDLFTFPEAISFLKLRGSWAEVGNDTSPFSLARRADIIAGTISANPNLPNPDLRPETTRSTEMGFDSRFMDNRFRLSFTWYKTNTFDQIFATPFPIASSIATKFENGADVQNTGVEIELGASVVKTSNFSWDIDVNFSKNTSEVLKITSGLDQITINEDFMRHYRLVKGGAFGDIYTKGFQRDDQGRVIVGDTGLPLITPNFAVKTANFNPDWLAGISNTFTYKNLSLSTLIDIRQGGSVVSLTEAVVAGNGLLDYTTQGRDGSLVFGENIFSNETAVTESGAPNTTSVTAEDFWNNVGGRNSPVGEAFVRDASNIRLRELVLGYTLPHSIIEKTFITSARVSLVGRNLFFITNKAGNVDPESLSSVSNVPSSASNEEFTGEGRDAFAPPTTRTFGLSLNIGF